MAIRSSRLAPFAVALAAAWLTVPGNAPCQEAEPVRETLTLTVEPDEGTVGDHLQAVLHLDLAPGTRFEPPELGDALGDITVLRGRWSKAPGESESAGETWIWNGTLAVYETGEFQVPPVRLRILPTGSEEERVLETEPVNVVIHSVLPSDDAEEDAELADIKPPASIEPDYSTVTGALAGVAAILLVAALLWWLHRRFARHLSAAGQPDDPFQRVPPHVWAYQQLQELLERDLGEGRRVDLFFEDLSRILKTYLAGRYRTDLLEHTTGEVPDMLAQAGAEREACDRIVEFLRMCDRVKFAGDKPEAAACRSSVEDAYRIVDATRPLEAGSDSGQRGAA